MNEGALLPDVGIFDQVGIKTHPPCHLLHGSSDLPMGATRDDDPVETLLPDSSFDEIEIFRKASQTQLFNMGHLSQLLCPAR